MICRHIPAFVALVVQAATFWLGVALISFVSVEREAWLWLYLGCAVVLAISSKSKWDLSLSAWLQVFLYALLFALIFWGANFALDTLNGSVKLRRQLPPFFHGLEFYLVCCPGIASVAAGSVVRKLLLQCAPL